MIKGTKAAIKDARKILDNESGKPDSTHPYPCTQCGSHAIDVVDDDTDAIRCAACFTERHYGGATLRVVRDFELEGVWYCEVGVDFETRIKDTKVKPPKKSVEDETLSAVEIIK